MRNALADAERQPGRGVRAVGGTDPPQQQVDPGAHQRDAPVRDDHRQEQGPVSATVVNVSVFFAFLN